MAMIVTSLFLFIISSSYAYASQSTITEAEGYACMGEDRSRRQTEQAALEAAKRNAIEFASTYMTSETHIKDFELEKDLVSAYANATVKIIKELEKSWYKDANAGDCFRIKIKVEVIPDEKAMDKVSKRNDVVDNPSAPLHVRLWTDKKEYERGDRMRIYIKGNKPFYASVIYMDAAGKMVQILPNPYRNDNYFQGGTIYEIPSGKDRFDLEISPPFGEENITVYASTSPLGEIDLHSQGGVYFVKTKASDIGARTRGIKLTGKSTGKSSYASEFYENNAEVKTRSAK
ncbi:MAG: DUF4384 domain-containing protein [Desulfobacterales bacterium]|uniref:DUF4384 domain-containing protein n=1 Tax=Candidatus Desulfaltia bathyphila TaxID=2841697 RepID=A0A8J6TC13_9BACT|nr:DUF4384 domain-containing protein [Candidatus Desulfaltia bathyphila]MBL7196146.1 DUF4384 domain-containing protein [Desulfobacterales bacterium]MBL7207382.1 DUF4384 domain-containing protein [Desulfobacterales bacterium]